MYDDLTSSDVIDQSSPVLLSWLVQPGWWLVVFTLTTQLTLIGIEIVRAHCDSRGAI